MVDESASKSLEVIIRENAFTIIRNVQPLEDCQSLIKMHQDYRDSTEISPKSHVLLILLRHFA